jgi:hypothetical protein
LYRLPIPHPALSIQIDPNAHGDDIRSCLVDYERLGDGWAEAAKLLRQIDDPNDQLQALKAIYLISQRKGE